MISPESSSRPSDIHEDPTPTGRAEASLVEDLGNASVLVVGDVMVDEYVWGNVERISPEAPVPVVEFRMRTHIAGGAANAAANIASLSGRAFLAGVVGSDAEASILRKVLIKSGVDAFLLEGKDRHTTTKTRIIGGSQQILRIDREDRAQVSPETETLLLDWIKGQMSAIDGVLISDYGKGVVTEQMCQSVIDLARSEEKPIVIDPKGRNYSKYVGATVMTPNAMEVRLAGEPLSLSSGDLEGDVSRLQSLLKGSSFLVTRGAEGVSLFQPNHQPIHISARSRRVFDVTGAGDTFAATLALAMAAGATLEDSAALANTSAGIVVGKVGTGTVDPAELRFELEADR